MWIKNPQNFWYILHSAPLIADFGIYFSNPHVTCIEQGRRGAGEKGDGKKVTFSPAPFPPFPPADPDKKQIEAPCLDLLLIV